VRDRALELLHRAVGDPRAQFRPGQWEAIQALVEGRERLLVVERTGWGKSLVYFIATRLLRNIEQALGVVPAQARVWLKRACDEGHVSKLSRPVRYVAAAHAHPLFAGTERPRGESTGGDSFLTSRKPVKRQCRISTHPSGEGQLRRRAAAAWCPRRGLC